MVRVEGGDDKVTIGDSGGFSVNTGDGNDTVTTGAGWIQTIMTGSGNDTVNLGSGFAAQVLLGDGNDKINVLESADPYNAVNIRGQGGVDTVSFAAFSIGITASLNNEGYQIVGTSDPEPASMPPGGQFQLSTSIENLTGTEQDDTLTGSNFIMNFITGKNVIRGLGGDDTISGLSGNDKLFGDDGADTLSGGECKDKLNGGSGNDRLIGGEDKDVLKGNSGKDVFVFSDKGGKDKIKGFEQGDDLIEIADHDGGFGGLDISKSGKHLQIDYDGGVILLTGKAGMTLTSDDFDFV